MSTKAQISRLHGDGDQDPDGFWLVVVEHGRDVSRRYITGSRTRAERVAAAVARGYEAMDALVATAERRP